MLVLADWAYARAAVIARYGSYDAWLHIRSRLGYDPKITPIVIGFIMVAAAIFLLLEFKGDAPLRKDP